MYVTLIKIGAAIIVNLTIYHSPSAWGQALQRQESILFESHGFPPSREQLFNVTNFHHNTLGHISRTVS